MTHIPRIFATQFMFVYLRRSLMPLKSDKRIRVDKIRKTPLEPTRSSGVFCTVLFFDVVARRCSLRARRPRHMFNVAGPLDITAQAR